MRLRMDKTHMNLIKWHLLYPVGLLLKFISFVLSLGVMVGALLTIWFFSTYFSAADFESVKIRQSIVGNKRDLNDVAKNIVFTGPFHQFWYDLHRWGHRSIYDAAEMEGLLRRAGFSGIK